MVEKVAKSASPIGLVLSWMENFNSLLVLWILIRRRLLHLASRRDLIKKDVTVTGRKCWKKRKIERIAYN